MFHLSHRYSSVYFLSYFPKSGTKQNLFLKTSCETTACNNKNLAVFVNKYDLKFNTTSSVSKAPATINDSVQHSPGLAILVFPS